MPKKPGNWNSFNCSSPWNFYIPLVPCSPTIPKYFLQMKVQVFCRFLGQNVLHPLGSIITSHLFPSVEPSSPRSSRLVGGTGDSTSSLWRNISIKISWNLAKHRSISAAGLISPLMAIKCLNLFVFPSFSVLLCALG